ncbi:hypothetical protein BGZ92_001607 [Podila epicladia]|nr:hypothetical protein BGZ92_001607 [Podila epicladia]
MSTEATSVIDREKVYSIDLQMPESEIISSEAPELQIYTWKDATLGEISLAIKKAIPDMIAQAGPGCLLEFRHMAAEADRSSYMGRDIGTVRLDQVQSISSTRSAPEQEGISTKDIHNNTRDSNRRSDRHSKSDKPNKSYEKTLQMWRLYDRDSSPQTRGSRWRTLQVDPDEEEEEATAEMDEEEVIVMGDVEETETADLFALVDLEEDEMTGTSATDGINGTVEVEEE